MVRSHVRRHGSRASYVSDRCRCPECREANRVFNQHRRRAIAYGTWNPMVDADPIRRHVRRLQAAGMGINQIIAVTGVGSGTLRQLMYGDITHRRRVRPATAAAILSVREPVKASGARVDAAPTVRRVQALIAAGWTRHELAEAADLSTAGVASLLHRSRITVRTERTVRELYHQLEVTPLPTTPLRQRARARDAAQRRGWFPPLAWDDIDAGVLADTRTTDPVTTDIDPIAVERATAGDRLTLTAAERDDVILALSRRGRSIRQVATQVGVSPRAVARRRKAERTT